MDEAKNTDPPVDECTVLEEEFKHFHDGDFPSEVEPEERVKRLRARQHEEKHAALCLSGGGIRSATFSLGVLQGLAQRGHLSQFHYLSTVSGGVHRLEGPRRGNHSRRGGDGRLYV